MFRSGGDRLELLLVKPGGPFWRNKDAGAWMIPKGGVEAGETPAQAAVREFEEETGTRLTQVPFPLATVRQAGGKIVEAFAVEGELDPATAHSNAFELEWPRKSGQRQRFPEIAEVRWMGMDEARAMMLPSQLPLLDALEVKLSGGG